eukprot:PhF_6_TR13701/c4_g3_i8/m.22108
MRTKTLMGLTTLLATLLMVLMTLLLNVRMSYRASLTVYRWIQRRLSRVKSNRSSPHSHKICNQITVENDMNDFLIPIIGPDVELSGIVVTTNASNSVDDGRVAQSTKKDYDGVLNRGDSIEMKPKSSSPHRSKKSRAMTTVLQPPRRTTQTIQTGHSTASINVPALHYLLSGNLSLNMRPHNWGVLLTLNNTIFRFILFLSKSFKWMVNIRMLVGEGALHDELSEQHSGKGGAECTRYLPVLYPEKGGHLKPCKTRVSTTRRSCRTCSPCHHGHVAGIGDKLLKQSVRLNPN